MRRGILTLRCTGSLLENSEEEMPERAEPATARSRFARMVEK